jgi:ornithine carbamoyltransferase
MTNYLGMMATWCPVFVMPGTKKQNVIPKLVNATRIHGTHVKLCKPSKHMTEDSFQRKVWKNPKQIICNEDVYRQHCQAAESYTQLPNFVLRK